MLLNITELSVTFTEYNNLDNNNSNNKRSPSYLFDTFQYYCVEPFIEKP